MKEIVLDSEKELIIRSNRDCFSDKFGRRLYYKSSDEVILKSADKLLRVGIWNSNTWTGLDEFVQYSSLCILFFRENSITRQYCVDKVFDIATRKSIVLTKEEIKEKYDIDLPREIKNPLLNKNKRRKKPTIKNKKLRYVVNH